MKEKLDRGEDSFPLNFLASIIRPRHGAIIGAHSAESMPVLVCRIHELPGG